MAKRVFITRAFTLYDPDWASIEISERDGGATLQIQQGDDQILMSKPLARALIDELLNSGVL